MDGTLRKHWLQREMSLRKNPLPTQQNRIGGNDLCGPFQLKHPFTCTVVGMTGSGKTVWVKNLLDHAQQTISPTPQRIVWCYAQWQPAYAAMAATIPGIEFVKGIPKELEEDSYFDVNVPNLICIDDQMLETGNDKRIVNLFTKGSHHRNLSVIYILQNMFHQGKGNRTISLNSHYLVLFKNPRDKLQVLTLAKQMYPRQTEYFLDKYEEAVKRPFGYLFVDLKPTTKDSCRLRSIVLPGEAPQAEESTFAAVGKELLKFTRQGNYDISPAKKRMRKLKDKMDDVLEQQNLGDSEKVIRFNALQNELLRLNRNRRYDPFEKLIAASKDQDEDDELTAESSLPKTPVSLAQEQEPLQLLQFLLFQPHP